MKLTVQRLKKLIREQMEEMSQSSDMPIGKKILLEPPEGAKTINDMVHYDIFAEPQANEGTKFYINYGNEGKVYLNHSGKGDDFPASFISGKSDGRTFTDLTGEISLGTRGFGAGNLKE